MKKIEVITKILNKRYAEHKILNIDFTQQDPFYCAELSSGEEVIICVSLTIDIFNAQKSSGGFRIILDTDKPQLSKIFQTFGDVPQKIPTKAEKEFGEALMRFYGFRPKSTNPHLEKITKLFIE